MGGLFGKPKDKGKEKDKPKQKPKANINTLSEKEKAVMNCKLTRDKIKDYIKRMEKAAAAKKERAKECLKSGNRDRAKIFLHQNKFHLEQVKIADGQLNLIDEQITNLESAFEMAEAVKVLENGNKVLNDMQKEMGIEKWEQVKEDMDELKEQQNEIGEFLKGHAVNSEEYEEAVEADYNKLLQDLANEGGQLPEAPKEEVNIAPAEEKKEEEKNEEEKVAVAA